MAKNYESVSLPKELVAGIDKIIKEKKELGYVSRADFIKHAVRHLMLSFK